MNLVVGTIDMGVGLFSPSFMISARFLVDALTVLVPGRCRRCVNPNIFELARHALVRCVVQGEAVGCLRAF